MTDEPTPATETPPQMPSADALAKLDEDTRQLVSDAIEGHRRANTESAGLRHELRESRQALERLQKQHETEQDKLIREAEERGRQAQAAEHQQTILGYERRIVTLAIQARAADRFNDPHDAVLNLPVDELIAEQDDRRRGEKIDKALADLLAQKPWLARNGGRQQPLVTQGGRSEQPNGRPRERSWLRG